MSFIFNNEIAAARERCIKFVYNTHISDGHFRLTTNAEPSAYARCFGIFSLHLLGEQDFLIKYAVQMAGAIADDLRKYKAQRLGAGADLAFDKPYLQLLCFSLSALSVLNKLHEVPLDDHILPLLRRDIVADLKYGGCLIGRPASGNQAMFIGIINLYAQKWLNVVSEDRLSSWVEAHLNSMNRYGLWGPDDTMTHLLFQNGYHQYEIFEYLGIENPRLCAATEALAGLADSRGHFGPYPGGGGCYDYDAVAILASFPTSSDRYRSLLQVTAQTLLSEQNSDGGFCDTKFLRPLNLQNLSLINNHVFSGKNFTVVKERARLCMLLMFPRHNRIRGHWSTYSREWGESDLWDTWFRMLTLARIQIALDPVVQTQWGFIDFPGIGYVRSHVMPKVNENLKMEYK